MDIIDPERKAVWGTRRMIMDLGILARAVEEEEAEEDDDGEVDLDRHPSTQAAMKKKVGRLQAVNPNVVSHERWLIENAKRQGTDVDKYANGK